jgi:IS30 family transposase
MAARGGVPPPARFRSSLALIVTEREEISRGLATGVSFRQIAARLGRAPSTVSREVGRHGGRRCYRAATADATTWERGRRPKCCRLATHRALRARVAEKLAADWSPQQIAGWLKRTYPKDAEMQVSHETIYTSLFVQSRGVLKKTLIRHLRRRRTMRRSKLATRAGQCGTS